MKHFLIFIGVALCLLSCKKSDDSAPESPKTPETAKRTVIVYMAGETNLSTYVQADINEMITGAQTLSDDYRLLVYVDRSSSTEKPFLARIKKDAQQPVDTLYKYAEDSYTSDPEAMREVLQRAQTLCPAESYGLVLWGHANGWAIETDSVAKSPRRAYGVDNGRNTTEFQGANGKWMNIPSMRSALESLGTKWKFVFADCCNMMGVEVAYELRNVTEYLIASPAEITGVGAPYDTIVKDLFISDDATMYHAICDDYHAQTDPTGGHLPISVVKTENLPALALATRSVLPQVNDYLKAHPDMTDVIYYYAYNYMRNDEKVMYDMNDVVSRALEYDNEAGYKDWRNVFDQTIVYSKMSTAWHANCVDFQDFDVTSERFGGISMFFPLEKYNEVSHLYNQAIKQMAWYQAVGWSSLGW